VNFDIAINGRPWKVAIEPGEGGQFTIFVKGKKRVVDASWIDAETLSLIDGQTAREVRFHRRDGSLGVVINGRMFEAVVALEPRLKRGRVPSGTADGRRVIRAPMPGRIVRVLVEVGDRVVARQPVVIVEAMKMENELRAPGDGVVKEVNGQEGAAIDAGTILVVIE
jgi:biotin carboxyl carrier protein